jgi:DNA topoisomerase-3
MRLIIAEKPSLARAIADVLPMPHETKGSAIYCGKDDVVAWCAGHIMELAPPAVYDSEYQTWSLAKLPIVPKIWQKQVKTPELFNNIKQLLAKASTVVHAGDPDREGQLLVDEVLTAIGFSGAIQRLLIQDLNPEAVKKALNDLRDNREFKGLSESAEARSKADWLYGLNMTRLYTLLGKMGGYQDVLSVGRVQTPLLGLIVRRDLAIESFKPVAHYLLKAHIIKDNQVFKATWQAPSDLLNEQGLILNQAFIQSLKDKLQGKMAIVSHFHEKEVKSQPPLPYELSTLQMDAAKQLGLSAKDTLDICQTLYERYQLITYPRSDCAYLPEAHFNDVKRVISAINQRSPSLTDKVTHADLTQKNKIWNDKKISAHHAIIPTTKNANITLSQKEQAIYDLIAKRYLAQFFPDRLSMKTDVLLTIDNESFKAEGSRLLSPGWQMLYQDVLDKEEDHETEALLPIPILTMGETLATTDIDIKAEKTKAPPRFNDATLISAMTNIAAFVEDKTIKKMLKETDGIGTPATQAGIIQTLFDRNYIEKKGNRIISTPTGRTLIAILPLAATTPDLTALWETKFRQMVNSNLSLESFLHDMSCELHGLVTAGKASGALQIPGVRIHPCPTCQQALRRCQNKKGGHYWRCANEACTQGFLKDVEGEPKQEQTAPCPRIGCTGQLKRHQSPKGYWWGCSQYKAGCKVTADDKDGEPMVREHIDCPTEGCNGHLVRRKSQKKDGYWWGCSAYKEGCKTTCEDSDGTPVLAAT